MSDKKISQLTASTTPLAGTEVLPIVQSSTTKKVAVSDLTAGRAVAMLSNTMVGATARNDVDRTGGSGYGYRMKGNDQDNVRFRFENIGGQIFELVGGNPGASNDGFCLFDATASAKRLYVGSTGDVTVNTGNLVIGTSGKGIDFSATPGTGTSELFADYEEGTFTPTLGGSATYFAQTGKYTKIGRVVYFSIAVIVNSIGTGSTTTISGLPFTAAANTEQGINVIYFASLATSVVNIVGAVDSSTTVVLRSLTAAAANLGTSALFGNSADIRMTGFYFV